MGNRALITLSTQRAAPAIYLHWNGGRASVLGFLKAARQLEIKADNDEELIQQLGHMIAGRFFGVELDALHVYSCAYGEGMSSDNGVYLINHDLEIIDRLLAPPFDEVNAEKTRLIRDAVLENRGATLKQDKPAILGAAHA
jgi:hypothetical protein